MSLFKQVFEQIKINQAKKFNCIAWGEALPRFSTQVPGISRGMYYGITGAPGAAKTQFTDHMFLYNAVNFARANGIEIEVVYFSFEVSKREKMIQGISRRLFEAYGTRIPKDTLMKQGFATGLSEHQLSKIAKSEEYFTELEQYVTFYDDRMTPMEIYDTQMKKIGENGHYDKTTGSYTPHNPDKYLIFITDHISLMQPESGQSLHQALSMFSNNNIHIKNKFGATVVNIHQQGVDSQVQQFTTKGAAISAKVEPKLSGLGDNRTLGRDYDLVLGLLSPQTYEIEYYREYNTKRFGDNCRFLSIAKNRYGEQGLPIALYFDGAVCYFEELPRAENFKIKKAGQNVDNEELYDKYKKGQVGVLDPDKHKLFNF